MLRPVLAWRAFLNLRTVYFFNSPIFFRAAANRGYGGPPVVQSTFLRKVVLKVQYIKYRTVEYTKYIKLNLNSNKTQGPVTYFLVSAAVRSSRFVLKNIAIGEWLLLRINSLYIYFLVWSSILFENQINVFVANRAYTKARKYISSNRNGTVHTMIDAYETHTSCDADLQTFQRF